MASLNEIAYRILNVVQSKKSDDDPIDITEIKFDVNNIRATLLKQKLDKFYLEIPENLVQTINNIELDVINSSFLLNAEVKANSTVLRSKVKIPKILGDKVGRFVIKEISASNILSDNFTVVNSKNAKYTGNGKFNRGDLFTWIEDDYVYVKTNSLIIKTIKYINVRAIFLDAISVASFYNKYYNSDSNSILYNPNLPYDDDSDFPVTNDMIKQIEDIILYNKLFTENTAKIDSKNDSSDSIREVSNE